ncbi:MAG TPA: FAD-dependent monooxygenase [Mycobacterium sp.]|nr:FAD-dependent monooxygenase [Mycobacterium sp.]
MAQPQTRHCEVLVIGAGPAGLAIAHWLRAWGVDVVVVERCLAPREHPQATMVNTRTTEILRFLGLSRPVLAESTTLESSSRVTFLTDLAGPEVGRIEIVPSTDKLMDFARHSPTLPVICPQRRLQQVMARSLDPAVDLLRGYEAKTIAVTDTGVRVDCTDVQSTTSYLFESTFAVLADGLHSSLREQVGIGTQAGPELGTLFDVHFNADLRKLTADRESVLYWILNPNVSGVLITVSPDDDDWLLEVPLSAGATFDPARGDPLELLRTAIGTDMDVAVRGSRTWSMGSTTALHWVDATNRVFVIGDSAHTFAPTGGFGMNTGIQDGHNLAWKIAGVLRGWAAPSLLASYEVERRPVADFNARRSADNARSMWALLSRAAALMAGRCPATEIGAMLSGEIESQRPHFDFCGQALGFRYGSDPVVTDVVTYSPEVAPGARAPHFWLQDERARVSTLDLTTAGFGLFSGTTTAAEWADAAGYVRVVGSAPLTHHAVVERAKPSEAAMADPTGEMLAAYGITGRAAVLVRPDGHTCAVLPGANPHRELIDAVGEFTTTGFGMKEALQR